MSEASDLSQKAGHNSSLNQAGRDNVADGGVVVNAATANIYLADTRSEVVAREYSAFAAETATQRMIEFDNAFVKRLEAMERLNALADPGFQKSLSAARVVSAGTDRPVDTERLVELMAERALDPNRLIRATVARAVQIIDDIDEERLQHLVWYHGGSTLVRAALDAPSFMEQWEHQLLSIGFTGADPPSDWLEHLHVVGAVRIDSSGAQTLKSITDWMTGTTLPFFMPGMSQAGLESKGDIYATFPTRPLPYVVHELKTGHYRLIAKDREYLKRLISGMSPGSTFDIESLADTMIGDFQPDLLDNTAVENFRSMMQRYELLAAFDAWRLRLSHPVYITHVGVALVWAYLKQKGNEVLPLAAWLAADD